MEPIFRDGVWYIDLKGFKFIDPYSHNNGNINNHSVNRNADSYNNYNYDYSSRAIKFNQFSTKSSKSLFSLMNNSNSNNNVINSYEDDFKLATDQIQNLIKNEHKDSLCMMDHVHFDTTNDMGSFFYCLKQLVDLECHVLIAFNNKKSKLLYDDRILNHKTYLAIFVMEIETLKRKRSDGLIELRKEFRMRRLDPNLDASNNYYTDNMTQGCYWKYDFPSCAPQLWKPFCQLIRNNTPSCILDETCRLCVNDEYSGNYISNNNCLLKIQSDIMNISNQIPINCQISNNTNGKNCELQIIWMGRVIVSTVVIHSIGGVMIAAIQIQLLSRYHKKTMLDINSLDGNGFTVTHVYAVCRVHVDILRLLKTYTANFRVITKIGDTLLMIAAEYDEVESMKFLVNEVPSVCDINERSIKNGFTALMESSNAHHNIIAIMQHQQNSGRFKWMQPGIDIDCVDNCSSTAAMIAGQTGEVEVLKVLQDHNATFDKRMIHNENKIGNGELPKTFTINVARSCVMFCFVLGFSHSFCF